GGAPWRPPGARTTAIAARTGTAARATGGPAAAGRARAAAGAAPRGASRPPMPARAARAGDPARVCVPTAFAAARRALTPPEEDNALRGLTSPGAPVTRTLMTFNPAFTSRRPLPPRQ